MPAAVQPPLLGRHEPPHHGLDDRPRRGLDQAELRTQRADHRRPRARAQPRERGAEQQQPAGAVAVHEAGLDGDPAAHAVAGDVSAFQPERVHRREHRAREPGRVVRSADRLVGLPEAGQVDGDHAVVVGQRVDGGQERGLRPAEAVHAHDRLRTGAGRERGDGAEVARAERLEFEPARVVAAAGRREEAHAHVQAAADPQAPGAERLHPAAQVGRDPGPGGRVGTQHGVGPELSSASRSRRRRPAITASHAWPPVRPRAARARGRARQVACTSGSNRSASAAMRLGRRGPMGGRGGHRLTQYH